MINYTKLCLYNVLKIIFYDIFTPNNILKIVYKWFLYLTNKSNIRHTSERKMMTIIGRISDTIHIMIIILSIVSFEFPFVRFPNAEYHKIIHYYEDT